MFRKKYLINENHLFDPERKTISVQSEDKRNIVLGNNESDIFLTLIERRPEVLSKEDLVELVWEDKGSAVYGSSVVQSISTLRKTLNDSTKLPLFIRTVPRKGYQFVGIITDVIEEKPIDQPVINKDENASITNMQETTSTKATTVSKSKFSFITVLAIALLSFSICGYLLYSSKQKIKPTDLVSAGDYKGIPVFSFGQSSGKGVDAIQNTSLLTDLMTDSSEIEKFIIASSYKGDLIVNTIYTNQLKNKTFIINKHLIK